MGKTGKARKKRKLLFGAAAAARTVSQDSDGGDLAHPGARRSSTGQSCDLGGVTEESLATTLGTLRALSADPKAYGHPRFRPLRSMLYALGADPHAASGGSSGGGGGAAGNGTGHQKSAKKRVKNMFHGHRRQDSDQLQQKEQHGHQQQHHHHHGASHHPIEKVSKALHEGRTEDAYYSLIDLHRMGIVPKLGSVCRWVRDADAARFAKAKPKKSRSSSSEKGNADVNNDEIDNDSLVVEPDSMVIAFLDRLMRVCNPEEFPYRPPQARIQIIKEPWAARQELIAPSSGALPATLRVKDEAVASMWKSRFREVFRVKGPERTPPNMYDLVLHISRPNAIGLEECVDCLRGEGDECVVKDETTSKSSDTQPGTIADGDGPKEAAATIKTLPPVIDDDTCACKRIRRVEVPTVPGAFCLLNVFTPEECRRIIEASTSVGFLPDVQLSSPTASSAVFNSAANAYTTDAGAANDQVKGENDNNGKEGDGEKLEVTVAPTTASVLAHNFVWLLDTATEGILFRRVKCHLNQTMNGRRLLGINRRCRIYRYADPRQTYRCHIDGAWTGSGTTLDERDRKEDIVRRRKLIETHTVAGDSGESSSSASKTKPAVKKIPESEPEPFPESSGEYLPDAYNGDRSSRMTFLVYLNEGMEGGDTIYHIPRDGEDNVLEARKISPRIGCVMVFPHSNVRECPLHEGSAVFSGHKIIIRTEVMYEGFQVV